MINSIGNESIQFKFSYECNTYLIAIDGIYISNEYMNYDLSQSSHLNELLVSPGSRAYVLIKCDNTGTYNRYASKNNQQDPQQSVLHLSLTIAKIILLQFALNNYVIAGNLVTYVLLTFAVFYDEIRNEMLLLKHSLHFASSTNQNVIHNCVQIHGVPATNKCIINSFIYIGLQVIHNNNEYPSTNSPVVMPYYYNNCISVTGTDSIYDKLISSKKLDSKLRKEWVYFI